MPTIDATSRHDLTDDQWNLLAPLLPTASRRGRPRKYPLRRLVDGVRYRTRVGCPWRDVPDRYGPWWRVYALFTCWQLAGVWECVESALREAADTAGKLSWQVSVDSTTARAHVHAAGARRDSVDRVAGEPDHHALGVSRGGWSTKTHVAIDHHRGVLSFVVTSGQYGDSPQMTTVLNGIHVDRCGRGRPRTRPDRVLADKAYSSRANRHWLAAHGIRATIPTPADQARYRQRRGSHGGRPPAFHSERYKDRHAVECGINILKHYRAFATRYVAEAASLAVVLRSVRDCPANGVTGPTRRLWSAREGHV